MNGRFKIKTIQLAICLAFPASALPALAAEPYPALPPTLSTAVTPNVLLHVDNSGSMNNYPPSGGSKRKIAIARDVAKDLIDKNKTLRWGLFSFDPNSSETGGILQAPIGSSQTALNTAIDGLGPDTWTPLGEAMFEISRYFSGGTSYYNKKNNTNASRQYTSPIQYRCQKNFAIVITDGVSTKDNLLPGLGANAAETYTSYNASNAAVTKTFKVCSSASTVSDISCPAKLEGSTVNNAFVGTTDDGASYGRSLRDVAMYAQDMDMRIGGLDLDNKSFDDDKFKKQNLTTYTVGFAIDDPVLKAAAIVGGGKNYTSDTQATLTAALTNAVNDIIASVSNAGGVATPSEVKAAGNVVLQPVFNPKGWYGELRCIKMDTSTGKVMYTLKADGTPDTTKPIYCDVPKAIIPASRTLYTSKVVGAASTPFGFDAASIPSMTATQKTNLGATLADQQNVVNFIRGTSVAGLRSRPDGLLGDIIDGQPTIVAKSSGYTLDPDYGAFQGTTATRNIAFIGANDGMLHAFQVTNATGATTMTELMGYVPSAVYPRLPALTKTDYGTANTPHVYAVNGSSRKEDVKIGTEWKTILAGGLGQGGQSYFAIDATSEATLTGGAASAVKWEWNDTSDSEMGYSFGAPIIYNVRTSATDVTPAVILSNGYENNFDDTSTGGQKVSVQSSALYVINASTGALLKKLAVTGGSGLSSPAGLDINSDGILDYVYAGDINGKVWRFDLSTTAFSVSGTPIFDAGSTHPIVQRPGIFPIPTSSGISSKVMVLFGTGKLLTDADRLDTTTQTLYGVVDDIAAAPIKALKTELQAQTVVDTTSESGAGRRAGNYRKLSTNIVDLAAKKGWYIDLPVSTERLVTSPMVYQDKVLFGTGITDSGEKCLPGGKGWVMGLNPLTGSVTVSRTNAPYSFVDINDDKRSSAVDQISFGSGAAYASGFDKDGIPTELTYVADESSVVVPNSDTTGGYGSTGGRIALREQNSMAVYRTNNTGGSSTSTASSGKGVVLSGTIGKDDVSNDRLLGPATGVKVETTIWREIK